MTKFYILVLAIVVGMVAAAVHLAETGLPLDVRMEREAIAFLEQNKEKTGVITTDSGLQYEVIREGDGESPSPRDSVVVHYQGQLQDGTVFDSSYARNEPAQFPVGAVIPGWTEGLQMMKTGGKYKLVIPPELGYGRSGAGGVIPPNAVLIFDVELLEVVS